MRDLEMDILSRLRAVIDAHRPRLRAQSISLSDPDIVTWDESTRPYSSEFRLDILKNGEIDGVLEFHIFLDESAVVSTDEAAHWLDRALTDLGQ